MEMTDIAYVEKWADLENKWFCEYGLQCAAFDRKGNKITGVVNWSNELCRMIKSSEKGKRFICAASNAVISSRARKTSIPVVDECDAGMVKIVVPVFVNGDYLGSVGGCGALAESDEADLYTVSRIAHIEEESLVQKTQNIPVISSQQAEDFSKAMEYEIDLLIKSYLQKRYRSVS